MTLGAAVIAALALLADRAAARDDPAFGFWLVGNGRAIIEVGACGERACGRIAWLADPVADDGGAKRDAMNPDPARRGRALCGLRILEGLERAGEGAWRDGTIYNTRDGQTYSVQIEAAEGGEVLAVRGYVGISLLGRTQEWRRQRGDRGGCPGIGRPGSER